MMFQCTDCEKTFERECNLTKHKEKKHPDVTLANPDDTVARALEVENTFIAQAAVNEDGIQFAKDIGTQSDFTQQYLIESAPDFSEDLGLEANSVSMRIAQLGQQLEQVQESIQDTSAEILDDSLSLVTSTQADPSSRQPGDLVPATNIQEIQRQLAENMNDSPSRRQSNFLSSTNPFNMIQMELLIPTPAKESSETRNINENNKFETCTVCKKICRDVCNLQEHLLTNHCGQSPQVLRTLEAMQQQLNTVLANQSTQEKKLNTIETKQNILSANIYLLNVAVTKAGERTTPFPLDGAPASVTQRDPSWAERVGSTEHSRMALVNESTSRIQ